MSPQQIITLDHNPSILQSYKVLHPQSTSMKHRYRKTIIKTEWLAHREAISATFFPDDYPMYALEYNSKMVSDK